jgi:uncharacterized protein with HEPN domain
MNNDDTVWEITRRDVPELKRMVEEMVGVTRERDNEMGGRSG